MMTRALWTPDFWKLLIGLWILALLILASPAFAAPQPAFQLNYTDAENAIAKALVEKGAGSKIAATIIGRRAEALFAYDKPCSIEVRGLQFDKTTGRWNGSLMLVSDGNVVTAIPAAGRFEELIQAVVLKRQVRNTDVISDDDIETRDFPLAHTRNDTITDAASLIGKSPVHTISPYRPIRLSELQNPAIIKKNGLVQMRYHSPGIEITTSGQAMEDGAKGDVISIRNVSSKKIVRAVIVDEHTVDILGATEAAAQPSEVTHATN